MELVYQELQRLTERPTLEDIRKYPTWEVRRNRIEYLQKKFQQGSNGTDKV